MNRKKELQIKRHQKRRLRRLRKWFLNLGEGKNIRRNALHPKFRRVNRLKAYKLDDRRRVGIL
jgi:hypothetical protein